MQKSTFAAIDIETANASYASICQLGVVLFEDGKEVHSECHLIDPEDFFDGFNVSIHGIDAKAVAGSPTFKARNPWLAERISTHPVVSHGPFDRTSLTRACQQYDVPFTWSRWLDSARVARRAWPGLPTYKLSKLAEHHGLPLKHHDALEDARVCGQLLTLAMQHTGIHLDAWFHQVTKPIPRPARAEVAVEPEGPLAGETIVFTGQMDISRNEAMDLARACGAFVKGAVTKDITMLVLGDRDVRYGATKSKKHASAEALLLSGHRVRVVPEADFLMMIKCVPETL